MVGSEANINIVRGTGVEREGGREREKNGGREGGWREGGVMSSHHGRLCHMDNNDHCG